MTRVCIDIDQDGGNGSVPTVKSYTTTIGDGSQLGVELTYSQEEQLLGTSGGVRKAAASAGFSAQRPVIEVRGTCGDCDS